MNVLFWTDAFWPRIGGMETQALQFVKELQKRGHRCMVLTEKKSSCGQEPEVFEEIRIRRLALHTTIANNDLQQIRSIRSHFEQIIRDFKPDIIHFNFYNSLGVFLFLLFKHIFHVPSLLTNHCAPLDNPKSVLQIERLFSSVDQICCVSKWASQKLETHLPQFKAKSRLIYNGLSMPDIPPSALPFSPPVLLLLGRLSQEKGFDTAIRAFSHLKNAKLIVAGDGPERKKLETLIYELKLTTSVQLIGEVTRAEVPFLINRATLVVIPSHFESFGLVALEAMQMGRPVIASNVGGLPEIVSDGETGLLVPPKDPIALSQAMQTLLAQPEKMVEMGMHGRKKAMQFSLRKNVTQYEELYRELVTR